ncbi:MAG: type IV toxin-antitoxin system AbiEi family antitoxin domain-containing protein [Steroidobacteraceae bacterium]
MHTDALYALRESDRIVELGRGLYRLAEVGEAEHPDLAVVAAHAPNAAVCLISALSYHNITTQIPSSVHLAVPRGSYSHIKLSTPVTVYRFDPKTFNEGLETRTARISTWRRTVSPSSPTARWPRKSRRIRSTRERES